MSQKKFLEDLAQETPEYQKYLERLDDVTKQRITNHINRLSTGLHATAPLICGGPARCPFIEHCPIPSVRLNGELVFGDLDNYPIYQPCVLETYFSRQKTIDYVQWLDVDPNDPFEMAVVNELVLIDLIKNRAAMILSSGDRDGEGSDLMKVDVTIQGFSENGTPLESRTTKIHPLLEVLEKLERRRQHWHTQLLETRKSKVDAQAKTGVGGDSDLLEEIKSLRMVLSGSMRALEADDEIIDI